MTLALAVLVPALGAVACFLAPRRAVAAVGLGATIAAAAAGLAAMIAVAVSGPIELALGGWEPPLGIALRADGFSAVMLATTAAIALAIGAHAFRSLPVAGDRGDGRASGPRETFWPLWLLLVAALNAVFVAADAFNVYVALELVTLPAVALVTLERSRVALEGAMGYLLAALLGSMAYLLGVALLYGETGTLELAGIAVAVEPGLASSVAIASMTAGLMIKAALFPLHFWLPGAHSNAPAPVSAALSALVITAAAYLAIRLWLYVLTPAVNAPAAEFVAALGGAAIIWGSVQALRAGRLKLIVAYSTVAQVGYLFILIALAWTGADGPSEAPEGPAGTAWQGGVYQAVAHALAKASLFLAAGNIIYCLGTDRLSALRGLPTRLPLTVATIAIAGHSLAGLPPSGGFTAKWLMLLGALEQGQWWWGIILVAGGLLTVAYLLRAIAPAFGLRSGFVEARPVPRSMEIAALVPALAAIAIGIAGEEMIALLEVGA